jgi:hypothetical protein
MKVIRAEGIDSECGGMRECRVFTPCLGSWNLVCRFSVFVEALCGGGK